MELKVRTDLSRRHQFACGVPEPFAVSGNAHSLEQKSFSDPKMEKLSNACR
jgi:hypothetical protein